LTLAPALGVYVHWPYCARICPYCDFNVVRERGRTQEKAALVEAILADLAAQAARIGFRRLVSIFFGGGTPSLMAPEAVGRIIETCRAHWPAEPDLEVTLEANPTDAEAGRFAAFAAAGVGRLSLGVQSLDDTALKALGRNHDAAAARRAMETAKTVFQRLSIDLIYARPDQTVAAWRSELAEALAFGPEHVSPYQLTIEAGTAFDRAVRRGTLRPPDEEAAADLYEATQDVLGAAGFEAYEVSNHARGEAARSRHNLVYWRGEDYLGVGPGAHGRITLADGRWATVSPRSVTDYIARMRDQSVGAESERLMPHEVSLERLLMGLRTDEGVAIGELAALPLDRKTLAELERTGLACVAGGRLRVTAMGRPVLDRITAELAAAPAVAG
jgi:putative oxygen-independent coproporphyrinogen III oxidase